MISERLVKARTILKENGVIFVSIDDAEQAYLKVLMDEIFGEENFIASFPVISNKSGRQVNTSIALTHEYLLCYGKNRNEIKFDKLDEEYISELMPNLYSERDSLIDENNQKYTADHFLQNGNSNFNEKTRPNLFYPIFVCSINQIEKIYIEKHCDKCISIWPPLGNNGLHLVWRWSKEKLKKQINDIVIIKNKKNSYSFKTKKYDFRFIPKTLIMGRSISTKSGSNLIKSINIKFNNPKPNDLIKFILKIFPNKNARVLDFFAGSGTTAHAVWDLNREDGGNRSVTLVTNNENGIGKNVTYERLHRISLGKSTDGNSDFEWLKKNEPYQVPLKVYETKQFSIDINNSLEEKIELFIKEMQELAKVNLDKKDDHERILYYLKQLYSLKNDEDQNETN